MTATKAIYAQSSLIWNQVDQNKSDVQFIVKIYFNLSIYMYIFIHALTYMCIYI